MKFWTAIILILVLSALGLTYEIAAGRVLAPFFGTSLVTWTAVIATVLAGVFLGQCAWRVHGRTRTPRCAAQCAGRACRNGHSGRLVADDTGSGL